jgi:phospholipid/cholesterol/gamma-HCH transport system substrate-binding protein
MRLKNEVTVGIVVVAAMVVLVIGAYWLSGEPWGEEQADMIAVFAQVGELREGNPVKYRGVQVGRVTAIELSESGQGVLVTMRVSPAIAGDMPRNPAVVLAPASLFGDWQASIIAMEAMPDLEFTRATVPGILPGATLPDITQLTAVGARIAEDLETLAGRVELAFTEETALKIRESVENIAEISAQLEGFVGEQTRTFDQVAQNALASSQNIERTTARVEEVATQVERAFSQGEINAILNNVQTASENLAQLSAQLEGVTNQVPGLVARIDTTLATVSTLVNNLEPAVEQVAPTIAEARLAVATLQRAAASFEQGEGTLGRLAEDPALYEETQRAVVSLQRLLADLQANPGKYIGALKLFP